MPTKGQYYTREEIAAKHGGSSIEYLPSVGRRIVCACLRTDPDYNPEAPRVILPGKGPVIQDSAAILTNQTGPIPVYLKRDPNAWEFVGNYEVESCSQSPSDIAKYEAQTGRPVTMVIFMKDANSTKFEDISSINMEGFPKTVYDDGETRLEVWKSEGGITREVNSLNLLIANQLLGDAEGAIIVNIRGDEHVSLDLPSIMNVKIRNALQGRHFEAENNDIQLTDKYLIIRLGDSLANDVGRLFDENGVVYDRGCYLQFLQDRDAEEAALNKAYYASTTTRPTHPHIAIIKTKLNELQAFIEAVEVSDDDRTSYETAVEKLQMGADALFDEIDFFQQNIPSEGGPEEESDALVDFDRRIKALKRMRRQKLYEIGYENPEDSDADQFANDDSEN
jgi:hypothetical protein